MNKEINKISISLVDDSLMFREALQNYFCTKPNIEILFQANNGKELIEQLKKKHPQIVLLDLEMPKMDGLQTLKLVRDKYPSIKFIILTMHAEKHMINSFLNLGANSYVSKSASPQEIYETIVNCHLHDFYVNDLIANTIIKRKKQTK